MAHASENMPYFIKPSINLSKDDKIEAYTTSCREINGLLVGETDSTLKMASVNCILKSNLPYYYWVGFYLLKGGRLTVGPYQGTLGCLHIELGKGVCGTVALTKATKIVKDVHTLSLDEEHITCDPNSQSEIVVPVLNSKKELIAVFDVDSSLTDSFDDVDQKYLELIMNTHFQNN